MLSVLALALVRQAVKLYRAPCPSAVTVPGSCACAQAVDSSQPDRAKDHLSKSLAPEHMARAVNRTAVGSSQRRVQARAEAHRRAVLEMGIFEVLLLCEIAVKDKSQPFHPTAKLHTIDRKTFPPLSESHKSTLKTAAQALTQFVEVLTESSRRLV